MKTQQRDQSTFFFFLWFGIFLFAVLIIATIYQLQEPQREQAQQVSEQQNAISSVIANAPQRGSFESDALIVAEFGDFQCPYCSEIQEELQSLVEKYPIRVVWFHLPNEEEHPESLPAAIASECANQQGRFWEYHDLLFENQSKLSPQLYRESAELLGFDLQRFQDCQLSLETVQLINNHRSFAHINEVNSTPTIIINESIIEGLPEEGELESLITKSLGS